MINEVIRIAIFNKKHCGRCMHYNFICGGSKAEIIRCGKCSYAPNTFRALARTKKYEKSITQGGMS